MEEKLSLEYCIKEAIRILKEDHPNADERCFRNDYEVAYWNGEERFIDRKLSWEYPEAYYPGLIAKTNKEMIDYLVLEGEGYLEKENDMLAVLHDNDTERTGNH